MTEGGDKQGSANDNDAPDGEGVLKGDAAARVDAVVLSIARLIGRRMAREDFEALRAANDNTPKYGDEQEPS